MANRQLENLWPIIISHQLLLRIAATGKLVKPIFVAILALLVSGCVRNPYTLYYEGEPDARKIPRYAVINDAPQIHSTKDFEKDANFLIKKGYVPFGKSSFNGHSNIATKKQLIEHAKEIGAQVVLVNIDYSHTVNGTRIETIGQRSQTNYSGTTTFQGNRGQITAANQGTAYTTSKQAVLVPYVIDRYDFNAIYFMKIRSYLGVHAVPVPDDLRHKLETNAGAMIKTVMDDSPAAIADIFPGDVILSVHGERVNSVDHLGLLAKKHRGSKTVFKIFRNGQVIERSVALEN